MNDDVIDEIHKFLAPIAHKNTHAIQIIIPSDTIHPITIPLQMVRVSSYFEVRKLTLEEYQVQDIL